MQPYLFPYLGYFQLISKVDRFVFYDNVSYIKQGWVNRNRLLVDGEPRYFTVPVSKASSHRNICDTKVSPDYYPGWRRKFRRMVQYEYSTAEHLNTALSLIDEVLVPEPLNIGWLAERSVRATCALLGISVEMTVSSSDHPASELSGTERLLEICVSLGADEYLNSPGGRHLYDGNEFAVEGIDLLFLDPQLDSYDQPGSEFVGGLSVLDIICRAGPAHAAHAVQSASLG